jgi:ArsR family transcriptional regulator
MDLDPQRLLSSTADATRLRIVFLLAQHGELCVCELVSALETQQPKVSKHLAVLRGNAIIVSRREGQWIHYRINPELPTWASGSINNLVQGCGSRAPYRDDEMRLTRSKSAASCG